MEFTDPYLTKQIIAYIGNKRKLLSLILKAVEQSDLKIESGLKFADFFCGSGVVSRFAKYLGFEVFCNDWEEYARILAEGFIHADKKDIARLFSSEKEYDSLLQKINSLPVPAKKDQYIAQYYAAHNNDISKADNKTERLFYTHQNALSIDKIRNYIEENFPPDSKDNALRRNILISNLIYECATHTNTSGVFKAFHKEFGGHGKDALSRILAPIQLHQNELINSKAPVHIYNEDANQLAKKLPPIDVAYLDPPYNQHQYGSNYHMLNTIAKWDKIPEPLNLNKNGVLKNKAGIRTDWIKTRSPYCYKDSALTSFKDLIMSINAKLILISYSSDGIIPFEEMKKICLEKGYVSIVTSDYVTYRGGKQSNKRINSDIEFILAIDTSKKSQKECSEKIDKVLLEKKILLMLKRRFSSQRLAKNFDLSNKNYAMLSLKNKKIAFPCKDNFLLSFPDQELEDFANSDLEKIYTALQNSSCATKQEELEQLIALCKNSAEDSKKYIKAIPVTLKKFAQKKYKQIFYEMSQKVKQLEFECPNLYTLISKKVFEVETIAEIRFST